MTLLEIYTIMPLTISNVQDIMLVSLSWNSGILQITAELGVH